MIYTRCNQLLFPSKSRVSLESTECVGGSVLIWTGICTVSAEAGRDGAHEDGRNVTESSQILCPVCEGEREGWKVRLLLRSMWP